MFCFASFGRVSKRSCSFCYGFTVAVGSVGFGYFGPVALVPVIDWGDSVRACISFPCVPSVGCLATAVCLTL